LLKVNSLSALMKRLVLSLTLSAIGRAGTILISLAFFV